MRTLQTFLEDEKRVMGFYLYAWSGRREIN